MAVLNLLDAVGENHKFAIHLIQFAAFELVPQLLAAQSQCVTAGVLAQHQPRIWHAHRLRRHDFIRQRIFKHAILVNSGFVSKRIAADDSLVRLHRNARDLRQHLAGMKELLAGNRGFISIAVGTDAHRHDDLFQGSIAGALADAVDGALNLARALLHSRQ